MNLSFFNYFLGYVFKSRTRQKLIFLSIIGLLISSFSLTVLQGVMGGLQSGLIQRSKNVLGTGQLDLKEMSQDDPLLLDLFEDLKTKNISFVQELELELMIQQGDYVSPIILHGVDYKFSSPEFLVKSKNISTDTSDIVIGSDLARSIRAEYGSKVKLTSPAHTDFLFVEVPRQVTSYISDFYSSELPEVDSIHGWVQIETLQNLVRDRIVNKLRFFDNDEDTILEILAAKKYSQFQYISWEEQNSTLVWALNLETRVMYFLFCSMSILIGICITSGLLIFFNKITGDLASFWILGLSRKEILRLIYIYSQSLAIIFCFLGAGLGVLFLILIDNNSIVIMPEQFVERNIPVHFDMVKTLFSFIIPYIIASTFTHYTFKIFKKESVSFISHIKKLN